MSEPMSSERLAEIKATLDHYDKGDYGSAIDELVAEVERLRVEIAQADADADARRDEYVSLTGEIHRLRTGLVALRDSFRAAAGDSPSDRFRLIAAMIDTELLEAGK